MLPFYFLFLKSGEIFTNFKEVIPIGQQSENKPKQVKFKTHVLAGKKKKKHRHIFIKLFKKINIAYLSAMVVCCRVFDAANN